MSNVPKVMKVIDVPQPEAALLDGQRPDRGVHRCDSFDAAYRGLIEVLGPSGPEDDLGGRLARMDEEVLRPATGDEEDHTEPQCQPSRRRHPASW